MFVDLVRGGYLLGFRPDVFCIIEKRDKGPFPAFHIVVFHDEVFVVQLIQGARFSP